MRTAVGRHCVSKGRPGYGGQVPTERPTVPPLPPALADPRPVMAVGTAGWVIALAVLLIDQSASTTAVVTCALGAGLGALGYGIFFWQRRAVRRGGRSSQRGLS